MSRVFSLLMLCLLLGACSVRPGTTVAPPTSISKNGKYYLDDAPPEVAPELLETTPDAVARPEPLHRFANRAYVVFGRQYQPRTTLAPFSETGIASWYGRRFHGQRTAIGEIYDMFAMTAAHPTAPLPSYMRVTNLENGRSAVVRVNDRGPFLHGRIIDLSYAAAAKLGFARQGSAKVRIELIDTSGASVLAPAQVAPPIAPSAAESRLLFEPLEVAPTGAGVFLQLAAFSNENNAVAFLNQLGPRVSNIAGVAPQIVSRDGWSRVRLGPFATREAALAVEASLRQQLGIHGVLKTQP